MREKEREKKKKDEQEGDIQASQGFQGKSEELHKNREGESGESSSVLLQRQAQQEA